jgi:hypothetical protein
MRSLALALLLTGCATAPAHLTAAKNAVDWRKEYVFYEAANISRFKGTCVPIWQMHNKPSHLDPHQGNCLDYAIAYREKLGRGNIRTTMLPDGTAHAYLVVDGWVLDVREGSVLPMELSQCR